jgi:hypothetical protein
VAENKANLLSSHIFDSAADATEAVRAADLLGLGVALSNRLVLDPDADDDSMIEEWLVEVYAVIPESDGETEAEAEVA